MPADASKLNLAWMPKLSLLLGLCVTFVVGCTVPTRVIVFNDSSGVITLTYKKSHTEKVELSVPSHGNVEVKGLLDHDFYVVSQSRLYSYPILFPPESFIENAGFGFFLKRVLKVSLREDLCIYLIMVESEFQDAEDQPKGFPLCPEKSQPFSGS